jgi:hypothetical protein
MMAVSDQCWRGVLVAPPSPLAGIGGALRHAFQVDAGLRSLHGFADLLAQLDRMCLPPPARRN